jgi:hypothetical protein
MASSHSTTNVYAVPGVKSAATTKVRPMAPHPPSNTATQQHRHTATTPHRHTAIYPGQYVLVAHPPVNSNTPRGVGPRVPTTCLVSVLVREALSTTPVDTLGATMKRALVAGSGFSAGGAWTSINVVSALQTNIPTQDESTDYLIKILLAMMHAEATHPHTPTITQRTRTAHGTCTRPLCERVGHIHTAKSSQQTQDVLDNAPRHSARC